MAEASLLCLRFTCLKVGGLGLAAKVDSAL